MPNLLDTIYISKDKMETQKYKEIKNMDFSVFTIKSVVEDDIILIFNKIDQQYYFLKLDSTGVPEEDIHFKGLRA